MAAAGLGRGLATYTANLARHLLLLNQDDQFCLFIAKNQPLDDFLQEFPAAKQMTVVRLRRPTRNIFLWDQLFWYARLKKARIDVFHSLVYGVPLVCPCKRVLTIHDLTPLVFPEFVQKFRHQAVFRFNFFTGKYADRIITSSQHSKRDLMQYLQISERKIRVIADGVSPCYRILPDQNHIDQIKQRYRIPGEYLLYVGGFDQNKNLRALLNAFAQLQRQPHHEHLFLVFVGALTPDAARLQEFAKASQFGERVILTGFVPEEDLIGLYNGAAIFVFPSLYEGFGLPPLEAMACGVPVITSNAASLPEVVGEAAIQVDPHSPAELARAMNDVLTNPELREDLRRNGLARAKLFSWEETAQKTLAVYQNLFRAEDLHL